MLNPGIDSKGQIEKMKSGERSNRLQDIWIWNGRPHWDDIFKEVREQRQHSDIGVCFCGAAVIGAVSYHHHPYIHTSTDQYLHDTGSALHVREVQQC
jgi:hypothetical protein